MKLNTYKVEQQYVQSGKIKFKKEHKEHERGFIFKRYKDEVKSSYNIFNSLSIDNSNMNQYATKYMNKLFPDMKAFDYTKPLPFLLNIVKSVSNTQDNDIILDFFAGSGTTGDAVTQLNAEDGGNRKYILVQLPERIKTDQESYKQGYSKISAITTERLRRAGDKIIEDNTKEKEPKNLENLDIGFKYYKLDSTNFKKWDNSPLDERYDMVSQLINRMENSIDNIKSDRTQDDFFTEILLKFGLPLNSHVEEIILSGKKVYSLHHKYLLICLEKDLTREIAEEMINYHTQDDLINQKCRVVFIDNHFKSDQEKANIKQTLKDTGYIEVYSF